MENKDYLELIIIRHAETNYKDSGDRDGCDGDLTKLGEKQAVELGQRLKDTEIDAYITSPLLRAFKTAAGVCNAKPDKPLLQIMPEITECGVPVGYYGCSEEYLKKCYPNTAMCEPLFDNENHIFGTKYYDDNSLRARKVIDYIKEAYSYGDRVVLFTHQGICAYLIRQALNIEKQTFDLFIDNTAMTKILFYRDGRILLQSLNVK